MELSTATTTAQLTLLSPPSDEDPQAILDEHLSRVLKTPGCQSPAVARHSPRSSSPEHRPLPRPGCGIIKGHVRSGGTPPAPALSPARSCVPPGSAALLGRQGARHVHHHYVHHHASPKTTEQIEREAALRVRGLCGAEFPPYQRSRSLGREMCGAVSTDSGLGSVSPHQLVFIFLYSPHSPSTFFTTLLWSLIKHFPKKELLQYLPIY